MLVAVYKIKELFPETFRACGGAISLKQTMSGGNNFLKFSPLSKFLGLEIISETLFYRIQKLL